MKSTNRSKHNFKKSIASGERLSGKGGGSGLEPILNSAVTGAKSLQGGFPVALYIFTSVRLVLNDPIPFTKRSERTFQ